MKFKTNAFAHAATRGAGLLAAAAMAWMPQTTRAQDLTLDDFSTGPGKLEATSGSHTVSQTGTGIVGGTRNISLVYGKKDKSEFGQESTLQVRPSTSKNVPSALIWSNGFDATPGIELEYFGLNQDTPLNLNLTNYDRFRVGFQGISTGIVLTAEVWYGGDFNTYGIESCGLPASDSPFTVDLPFSTFAPGTTPITWSALDGLFMELTEGTSALNSPNLAITGYSAILATDPAGTITCGPPAT